MLIALIEFDSHYCPFDLHSVVTGERSDRSIPLILSSFLDHLLHDDEVFDKLQVELVVRRARIRAFQYVSLHDQIQIHCQGHCVLLCIPRVLSAQTNDLHCVIGLCHWKCIHIRKQFRQFQQSEKLQSLGDNSSVVRTVRAYIRSTKEIKCDFVKQIIEVLSFGWHSSLRQGIHMFLAELGHEQQSIVDHHLIVCAALCLLQIDLFENTSMLVLSSNVMLSFVFSISLQLTLIFPIFCHTF